MVTCHYCGDELYEMDAVNECPFCGYYAQEWIILCEYCGYVTDEEGNPWECQYCKEECMDNANSEYEGILEYEEEIDTWECPSCHTEVKEDQLIDICPQCGWVRYVNNNIDWTQE